MNFFDHRMSFLSTERFIENEYGSERFVIHRLIFNQGHDPHSYGGLMIAFEGNAHIDVLDRTSSQAFADKKIEIESKVESGQKPQVYPSHAAFQLTLLQPFWTAMGGLRDIVLSKAKPNSRVAHRLLNDWDFYLYRLSQAFAAILSASVLTFFLLWVRREFSLGAAYITLFGLLVLCPPLTYFGRNLWWMMGLWFIPMVTVFWGYSLVRSRNPAVWQLVVIGGISGFGTFMRVSCGYEYASTVMMSALVPVVYYAVKNRQSKGQFFVSVSVVGGLVFCGFLAAVYNHIVVLQGAGYDALAVIKDRFMMRASDSSATGNSEIAESVRASVFVVLAKYLFEPQRIAWPEILYLLPVLIYWKKWKEQAALFAAMGAAFIGAISMFIILKGHAYIHGFDVVAWFLPLNILIILWGAIEITKTQVLTGRPR